jgi:hypothetical protein
MLTLAYASSAVVKEQPEAIAPSKATPIISSPYPLVKVFQNLF